MSPRSPHCPGPATPSLLAGPRGGGRTWLCCPLQLVLALRPLHWASTPVGVQLGTVNDKDTRVGVLRGGVKSTLEVASRAHTVHSGRALGSFDALDLSAGGVFTYHQITALRSLQDAGFASHRVWIFVVGINSAAPLQMHSRSRPLLALWRTHLGDFCPDGEKALSVTQPWRSLQSTWLDAASGQ